MVEESATRRARNDAVHPLVDAFLVDLLIAGGPDPISVFDRDLRVAYVNHQVVAASGITEADFIGRTVAELGYSDEQRALWEGKVQEVFASAAPLTYDYEIVNEFGLRWYEAQLLPVVDGAAVSHVAVISHDVTERVTVERRLSELARTDTLTGLYNRFAVLEAVAEALAEGRSVTVVSADLDGFGFLNDSLGHPVGDAILRAAGERLTHAVGVEALVARHAGDEFVLVFSDLSSAEVAAVCERLCAAFRLPIEAAGRDVGCTLSIGVHGPVRANGEGDAAELLRDAGMAMRAARDAGGDRVHMFGPALVRRAEQRLSMERRLAAAIAAEDLEVHYQPEVHLGDRSLHGVEALLRWRQPDGGLLAAGAFIDVAEQAGLVVELGAWALETAVRQAAAWAATGPLPEVTRVNVSAVQLADPGFADLVAGILGAVGLEPVRLGLEVTETAVLQGTTVAHNLHRIRELGVGVALDDFGTGYSSLSVLAGAPADLLKIDLSFVRLLEDDVRMRQLVSGMVELARRLELEVTAEGVETPGQRALLQAMGCDLAQGFMFSPALPADGLAPFLVAGVPVVPPV